MSLGGVLVLLLVLAVVGVLPGWKHSRGWGYRPVGGLGLLLLVVLVLVLSGRV